LLYGRVGMISLGQIALFALGGWITTRLAYVISVPFPVLLLISGVFVGLIGVLLGLPALRLSGLHLALITLMFAAAITLFLSKHDFANGGGGFFGVGVQSTAAVPPRPNLGSSDHGYYRYCVIVGALMFLLVLAHVSTKPGRAWAAIRESEPAALAAGINITLYKLWAFGLAAFITGVAGGLIAGLVHLTVTQFPTTDSLIVLAVVLMGGTYSMWGAIIAGLFLRELPDILEHDIGWSHELATILFGIGVLQVITTAPRGIVEQFPKDMRNLGRKLYGLTRKAAA
jgi:branched-chain amino acid transport system permease protein